MSHCLACKRPWEGRELQCDDCRAGRADTDPPSAPAQADSTLATEYFPDWCEQSGLPRPVREHRFALPRRWRFDFAWPVERVALECEGGVWTGGRHVRGKGYVRDMEKYTEASLRGWTLIRRTPDQLCTAETLDLLRQALRRAT